jgi:hypothetical protein
MRQAWRPRLAAAPRQPRTWRSCNQIADWPVSGDVTHLVRDGAPARNPAGHTSSGWSRAAGPGSPPAAAGCSRTEGTDARLRSATVASLPAHADGTAGQRRAWAGTGHLNGRFPAPMCRLSSRQPPYPVLLAWHRGDKDLSSVSTEPTGRHCTKSSCVGRPIPARVQSRYGLNRRQLSLICGHDRRQRAVA